MLRPAKTTKRARDPKAKPISHEELVTAAEVKALEALRDSFERVKPPEEIVFAPPTTTRRVPHLAELVERQQDAIIHLVEVVRAMLVGFEHSLVTDSFDILRETCTAARKSLDTLGLKLSLDEVKVPPVTGWDREAIEGKLGKKVSSPVEPAPFLKGIEDIE